MIKEGFALVRISDGEELAWWEQVPSRVDIPGTSTVVMGAAGGWTNGVFLIESATKEFPDPDPPPPIDLAAYTMTQRDALIDGGVTFEGVVYQTGATDRENILGASQLAFMAIVAGAQPGDLRWHGENADFEWIALDNSKVAMDAQTVVAFGRAAAARKSALIFAARTIKDGIAADPPTITATEEVDAAFAAVP